MHAALPVLAVAIEACCIYLVALGDLRAQVPAFWAGFFPALLCYALATLVVLRRPHSRATWTILGAALVFRLTLWWSPPTLSDDIFRYVWDGRVQLAGINPYLHPPAAPELAHLRDELHGLVNHPDVPTIYPPLAQLFFRLVCALSATPAALKFALLLCDFGLCLLLRRSLVRRGQDPCRVLLYAWHPLPVVEIAGSGHIDALGILLLFGALYALQIRRIAAATAALAGAFLAKLVPLVLLPALWRQAGKGWFDLRPRRALIWFPALALLGYMPFAEAGSKLATGLSTYAQHWHFNAAVYALIQSALAPWDAAAHLHARWLCAALLVALGLRAQIQLADPYAAACTTLGAYVLLSPTMHPWYLLWILPFLPFFAHPAWGLLGGLVALAYHVLIDYAASGIWREELWILWAQYAPFYSLLLATALHRHKKSNEAAAPGV